MADTTIQPDVDETLAPTEEEVTNTSAPLERDSIINDLAARQRESRDKIVETDEDPEEVSEPKEVVDEEPADELVMLKVNGREIFKPQSEVDAAGGIAALQKTISGDMKLKEAAEEKKQIQQREQNILRKEQELFKREQQMLAKTSTPEEDVDIKKQAEEMAEAFFLGDSKSLTSTFEKVLAKQKPQPKQDVNTDDLTSKVVSEAQARLDLIDARKQFSINFKDIDSDPIKRNYANEMSKRLLNEHPNWSPAQILTESGKRTRAAIKANEPVKTELQLKEERKAATVTRTPSSNQRGPSSQQTIKPKTAQQIFEEMQASRSH
jgi:hypothetical protein